MTDKAIMFFLASNTEKPNSVLAHWDTVTFIWVDAENAFIPAKESEKHLKIQDFDFIYKMDL